MNSEIGERIRRIRENLGMNQKDFSTTLLIKQQSLSKYENGGLGVPDKIKVKFLKYGVNLAWLLTGEGPMFQDPNARASAHLAENSAAPTESKYDTVPHLPTPGREGNPQDTFRIPILSRETARDFEPIGLHDSKAHSGDFPDYMVVDVPLWLREYSSDLRAVMVFYDRMIPLLYSGDVAIIKATGWSGEGIYLYKSENQVHISHVRVNEGWQMEFESSLFESFHDNDAKIIGRVVAVLHPVYNRAIEAAELARVQLARQRERESKSPPKPAPALPPAAASSKAEEAHEPVPEYGRPKLQIPHIIGAAAGEPREVFVDDMYELSRDKVDGPAKDYVAVTISGTSMTEADINDGDVVIVRRDRDLIDGRIFLVRYEDEYVLKRYRRNEEGTERLDYEDGSGRSVVVRPGDWQVIGAFCFVAEKAGRAPL